MAENAEICHNWRKYTVSYEKKKKKGDINRNPRIASGALLCKRGILPELLLST